MEASPEDRSESLLHLTSLVAQRDFEFSSKTFVHSRSEVIRKLAALLDVQPAAHSLQLANQPPTSIFGYSLDMAFSRHFFLFLSWYGLAFHTSIIPSWN